MQASPSSRSAALSRIVVIGTGGTIAGTAADAHDDLGYAAGQLSIFQLIAALPALDGLPLELEQLAQVDSKDMSFALWLALATAVARHLARAEVAGVVITHGTDTLEETAYFLQRVLSPDKPVVLTGAMKPATSAQSDGPKNLLDAVTVARRAGASGVVVVMAGKVHGGLDVRKRHTLQVDAFESGDAGPTGQIIDGRLNLLRPWPAGEALELALLPSDIARWPRVEIVTSHAGAGRAIVDALRQSGAQGIVVAGTGNGTLHQLLEAGLMDAQAAGVRVLRSSRCLNGGVSNASGSSLPNLPLAGTLTSVQARIELMLQLMEGQQGPVHKAKRFA